ncbi:hypothetical protein CEXT_599041 [Caerostris extrusa]|uniref:Secreted protein n=1 Tax=Caerostris extrusa TaxID=172846 RepID=A0AAV4N4Q8_CAEEX|nr:hypothetical protein CEXT_599041 [Caerostris extrusa]
MAHGLRQCICKTCLCAAGPLSLMKANVSNRYVHPIRSRTFVTRFIACRSMGHVTAKKALLQSQDCP